MQTMSASTLQKKKTSTTPEAELPPMKVTALPAVTTQRISSLRASSSRLGVGVTAPTISSVKKERERELSNSTSSTSSGKTSAASSLQRASDMSLRGSRQQLPTIAGSPSVSVNSKDSLGASAGANMVKDTPTKIPRIASHNSTGGNDKGPSPQPSFKSSLLGSRRGSVHSAAAGSEVGTSVSTSFNEFGLLETPSSNSSIRQSIRGSPQSAVSSKATPRQSTLSSSASTSSIRKPTRESISFSGLRKTSVSSLVSGNNSVTETSSRLSLLSPAKSIKLLTPKVTLPTSRQSSSPALQTGSSSSSGRMSISTPSPVPAIDEEEMLGDEEMMNYIRRQQAKKLANGARKEDLDGLLRFPEPIPPAPPMSPNGRCSLSYRVNLYLPSAPGVLKSPQSIYLSEYERREILDFQNVYCIGARSEKKQATRDNSTNNHGYDDERGDYLVVARDHLAYRYEVVDTLGKGSFGQVLQCRDHCTGESVAIKIIRNKKRFHHQALVEIKILDSLRKWVCAFSHIGVHFTDPRSLTRIPMRNTMLSR